MKKFNFKKTININEMEDAADAIKNGKLVIFPTETVYGIGANVFDENAVRNIFIAKGRANDNPLIVHVANVNMIKEITLSINEIEQQLIDAFMPGPFTLVLKKKKTIPNIVSANLDTIGVRIPKNKIANLLIEKAGVPVAAPSANISSLPSGTNITDIEKEFEGKVDFIIDGGDTEIGIESTVCQVIEGIPTILRPGKITDNDILKIIGVVKIDNYIHKKTPEIVLSPGTKYKHYAPKSKCLLVYSENADIMIDNINKNLSKKTIVLGFKEHRHKINSDNFYELGSFYDLDQISHNIFSYLRKADRQNPDLIIIEGVPNKGFGIAIMNRLIKAADYNYLYIKNND